MGTKTKTDIRRLITPRKHMTQLHELFTILLDLFNKYNIFTYNSRGSRVDAFNFMNEKITEDMRFDIPLPELSSTTFLSIDDVVNYISEETISEEFKKCLEFLKKHNIKIEPYKGGNDNWLECTYQNEDIAYLATRRKYFLCQTYDEENDEYNWPPYKLFSYDNWISECWKEIENEINELDNPDDD